MQSQVAQSPRTIQWTSFSLNVRTALVEASNYCYTAPVFPYSEDAPWTPMRCRQPAALRDYIIERDDINTKPAEILETLSPGDVRQLIAGTGVGKSTKMPFSVVRASGRNGIVLSHNTLLPDVNHGYVSTMSASWGGRVNVLRLSRDTIENPADGASLYYASAAEFLAYLIRYCDIVEILRLDFIVLDESHVTNPEYEAFRYLVALKKLEPARVLYATATGSADLTLEGGGFAREVVSKPLTELGDVTPDTVRSSSPMHYSNVVSKTMVFLADDEECQLWYKYYEERDVPAFIFGHRTRNTQYNEMLQFLSDCQACVVLTTSRLQDSYTLDLDVVVDNGYTTRLIYDVDACQLKLVRTAVTKAERIQRVGRVARLRKGKAYVADVKYYVHDKFSDHVAGLYKYLWCVALNIEVKNPDIARYKDLVGGTTSRLMAAMLLNARLPPIMVVPYLAADGFYTGFGRGMRRILAADKNTESTDANTAAALKWPARTTGVVEFSSTPIEFRSLVGAPRSWLLPLCYAWLAYTEGMAHELTVTRSRMSERPRSVDTFLGPPLEKYTSGHRYSESLKFARGDVKGASYLNMPVLPRYSVNPELVPVDNVAHEYDAHAQQKHQSTAEWVKSTDVMKPLPPVDTKSVAKSRRASRASSGESSPVMHVIKQVKPTKYKSHKLYPVHDVHYKEFIASESARQSDWNRYDDMCKMKVLFSSLGKNNNRIESMKRFFLSIIKVHNSALLSHLQSGVAESPTNFQKFFKTTLHDDYRLIVDKTAKLLEAFELESFFVGIDTRTRHSKTSDAFTPDHDGTAQLGAFFVTLQPADVQTTVALLKTLSKPLLDDKDQVRACAWIVFGNLLSVLHAFDFPPKLPPGVDSVLKHSEEHDLILFDAKFRGVKCFPIAKPVAGNELLVLAHDVLSQEFQVHGPFKMAGDEGGWYMPHAFSHGYSGAIVFDVAQNAVVGLYAGSYTETEYEKYGKIVNVDKFLKLN